MRTLCLLLVALSTFAASVHLSTPPPSTPEPNYDSWMLKNYKEISALRVGMTRADLLQVFGPAMGLSTRVQGRYAYRPCTLIKVDVEFEPVGLEGESLWQPQDRIVKISKPFLE